MKLTELNPHPQYTCELPLSKHIVTFRPWTVKEEKILLVAKESNEMVDKIRAVQQIVELCSDVDKNQSVVDLEFLFLQIRKQSIGSKIPLYMRRGDEQYDANIDLDLLEVIYPENHNSEIKISDEIYVTMKYPTYETMFKLATITEKTRIDILFQIIVDSIDTIITPKTVYNFSDYSAEEKIEFLETLRSDQLEKLEEFFNTIPYLYYKIIYEDHEGESHTYEVKNISDFF